MNEGTNEKKNRFVLLREFMLKSIFLSLSLFWFVVTEFAGSLAFRRESHIHVNIMECFIINYNYNFSYLGLL